ncbi:MAG TPA: trypsin-like peptidase domain-containing protein [Candidatus Saccharimonadales bacterium]|nr:trypsin-like peptidase domain-containing protein [Candidatus Saccharimonadales bacterium]
MKRLVVLIAILIGLLVLISAGQQYLPSFFQGNSLQFAPQGNGQPVKVVTEESITIDIVKKYGPSAVTVTGTASQQQQNSPFGFNFPFFGMNPNGPEISPGPDSGPGISPDPSQNGPQSIGSGFIVTSSGMIVTNKHVVSDTTMTYQVVTSDGKKYSVKNIYRDPLNDVALLKIDPGQNSGTKLTPLTLGDSSNLQVGQYVIAIGTALGELRNTVTTGVVSGLGRGITAGSPYEGSVEQLNNVIQTDAAINPGNSGGPLFNSSGQVIGVNTAVSQNGQNIGFAIPINVIKDAIQNFQQNGSIKRPFLGVSYTMLSKNLAVLNNLPQGAYVQDVQQGSPADNAGIQQGDVITKIDGQQIDDNNTLASVISKDKVGQNITLTISRDGKNQDIQATLTSAPQQ